MNQLSTLVVALTIGILAGCSPQSNGPAIAELPQRVERPLVDSPDYLHWQRFPLETKVVHKKVATNGQHEVTVTTRLVLKEKTPEKIVVEQQITVEHPATGSQPASKLENPPQKLEYAAKFRLPEGIDIEKFSLPSIKAERTGTELSKSSVNSTTPRSFGGSTKANAGRRPTDCGVMRPCQVAC